MIALDHVTKRYGRRAAVEDLSLTIKEGTTFGFLGQNGAGKTTTMKMLVGLAAPDRGTVSIDGRPASDLAMRAGIGYMPEAPYFYERLTGVEFLRFCAELFGIAMDGAAALALLGKVGIEAAGNRAIGGYSKGMKQRLGFAQALVNDPAHVFLDEPLDGLDPLGRKEIKRIIKELRAEGRSVFFNSHILYDTEELCDEIGILHEAKLVYAGSVRAFCAGKPLEDRFVEIIEGLAKKAAHASGRA